MVMGRRLRVVLGGIQQLLRVARAARIFAMLEFEGRSVLA
jgi:hypothetical protein